jgi:pyridoxine 5'-phosphate synthase PdxJ
VRIELEFINEDEKIVIVTKIYNDEFSLVPNVNDKVTFDGPHHWNVKRREFLYLENSIKVTLYCK